MNRTGKHNLKLAMLGIVAIVAGFIFFDQGFDTDGIKFSIPVPNELSFAGQTLSNSNASIECILKQTTYGIDSTGMLVTTIQSKPLTGNPLLSLSTTSGVKMAGYVVEPKIFCRNTFNDDKLSNPDKFTFVIEPSAMVLQVTSTNKDGTKVGTHATSFNTKSVSIPVGGKEQSLGTISVMSGNIEDNLSDGTYDTLNQFDLKGNLVVYWKGFAGQTYTIPVKFGEVSSYHNAKISKGSTATTTFTGNDKDGDGILDSYDKCIDKPENYNGYQDGDGCPDTAPVTVPQTTPTSSAPAPISYTQCLANKDHTWYMDSTIKTQSYCAVAYHTANGICGFYDISTKVCYVTLSKIETGGCVTLSDKSKMCITDAVFKSGGTCYKKDMDLCVYNKEKSLSITSPSPPISSGNGLSGKVLWQGEVKYSDGTTGSFLAKDDVSPFSFSIPLASLIGGVNAGEAKQISQLTLHPILKFDNAELHKKITTKSSNAEYIATMNIKGAWITLIPKSPLPDFAPNTGTFAPDGISLGNIILRMVDVENKVPSTVVGINDSTDVQIKVAMLGTIVFDYNNGNVIKPLTIQLTPTTAPLSSGATFTGETSFIWTNLKVVRGTSPHNGGDRDDHDPIRCPIGQIGYVLNGVLICQEKGTIVTDDDGDGVIDRSSGGSCAGLTPTQCYEQGKTNTGGTNTSVGGICPLDSGQGDSNGDGKICQICQDSSGVGVGGFPCDEGYRNNYCNDTTTCNAPKVGDNLGNGVVVTDDGKQGNDECVTNTLSLANDACVIQTGEKPIVDAPHGDFSCNDILCTNSVYPIADDPNMIWYLAGGVLLIGIIAIAVKRRR